MAITNGVSTSGVDCKEGIIKQGRKDMLVMFKMSDMATEKMGFTWLLFGR